MSVATLKATMPSEHHAALDAALAGCDAATAASVGGFLQALIALLQKVGANINWTCVISVIPQAIAAISNPSLWLSVLTAYEACANPPAP